jgi:hypothetical protein
MRVGLDLVNAGVRTHAIRDEVTDLEILQLRVNPGRVMPLDITRVCQYPLDPLMGKSTRAITIAASPEQLWPWIVQMGFERAGFY